MVTYPMTPSYGGGKFAGAYSSRSAPYSARTTYASPARSLAGGSKSHRVMRTRNPASSPATFGSSPYSGRDSHTTGASEGSTPPVTLSRRTFRPPTWRCPTIRVASYAAPGGSRNGCEYATVTLASEPSAAGSSHVWSVGHRGASDSRASFAAHAAASSSGVPSKAPHGRASYSPAQLAPSIAGLELTISVAVIGDAAAAVRTPAGRDANAASVSVARVHVTS